MRRRILISGLLALAALAALLLWPREKSETVDALSKSETSPARSAPIPKATPLTPVEASSLPRQAPVPHVDASAIAGRATLLVEVDPPGFASGNSKLRLLSESGQYSDSLFDASGVAAFRGLQPGAYWARLFGPSHELKDFDRGGEAPFVTLAANESRQVVLALAGPNPAEVSGYVLVEGNPPVGFFRLSFRLLTVPAAFEQFSVQSFSIKTKEDGSYSAAKLPPGKYLVDVFSASPSRTAYARREIELAAAPGNRVDFLLRLGRLRGRVIDRDGAAVRGVPIKVMDEHGVPRGASDWATDDRGEFQSEWLPAGEYRLQIMKADKLVLAQTVVLTVGEMDLGALEFFGGGF